MAYHDGYAGGYGASAAFSGRVGGININVTGPVDVTVGKSENGILTVDVIAGGAGSESISTRATASDNALAGSVGAVDS